MAARRVTTSIPIWVRVSAVIALVLVGVVISSMLLGSTTAAPGHSSGGDMSGMGQMRGMDHGMGQAGPAAPCGSEPMEHRAPSGNETPPKEGGPSDAPADHTRPDGRRGH